MRGSAAHSRLAAGGGIRLLTLVQVDIIRSLGTCLDDIPWFRFPFGRVFAAYMGTLGQVRRPTWALGGLRDCKGLCFRRRSKSLRGATAGALHSSPRDSSRTSSPGQSWGPSSRRCAVLPSPVLAAPSRLLPVPVPSRVTDTGFKLLPSHRRADGTAGGAAAACPGGREQRDRLRGGVCRRGSAGRGMDRRRLPHRRRPRGECCVPSRWSFKHSPYPARPAFPPSF